MTTKCLDFTFLTGFTDKSCFTNLMSPPLIGPITNPPPPTDREAKHSTLHEGNVSSRKNKCVRGNRIFTENQLQPAGVPGIFPYALSEMHIREEKSEKFKGHDVIKKKWHTKCSRPHPLIYNKSFDNNSGACSFWRLLACFECSLGFGQLTFQSFESL